MTPTLNLTFADAMDQAKANAQQAPPKQEGTPAGNPNAVSDWHAAIAGVQAPGSLPSERAQAAWTAAVAADTADTAVSAAEHARLVREEAAERAQHDAEWAAQQAAAARIDVVGNAARAKAWQEAEDAKIEDAHQVQLAEADRQVAEMWARREAQSVTP